jgi:ATP-dependent helicase YprA (DUF1998 family)
VIDNEYSYVFDSETGGSGVTMLLTSIDEGEYKNFRHATDLFYNHLSTCKCDDGCPNCVFQFGCSEGNDPRKLSRKNAKRWMDNGVRIVERAIE